MFRDNEDRPFLNKEQEGDEPTLVYHPRKTNRVLPPLLTFLITSLLWLLVMLWTRPDAPPSHGSAPDAQQHLSHKPLEDEGTMKHHEGHGGSQHGAAHVHPPESKYPPRHNITSHSRMIDCGNTPAEARANKCVYDILLNAWVPEPCFDQEFIDEYTDDMSWGAFTDDTMTTRLTVEQMGDVDHYYTSMRDHVNHCAMIWKKQFWVLFEERRAVDAIMASPGHTDHCAQYLMDALEVARVDPKATTKVMVGYTGCWIREDGW
ncbi:hypothetical protein B0T11DRAFT_276659 [Plectosphaerella cucumerina]|jgi:hypothetical protein|uniref:Uncharacterized protein n=1 Tax=Plectosphaerella cucumerina TaxID=40658 RepID=A0A8K0X6E6_9PEZI|nr:hypothetical protein B0T11DRAFT_276659 [Plectosphaerella cucumerina]